MFYYARINKYNICVEIVETAEEVTDSRMIRIAGKHYSLIGRKYENGEWVYCPQTEPPLTEAEEMAINNTLNIEYLVCLAESDI